jgi:hypothetical protein
VNVERSRGFAIRKLHSQASVQVSQLGRYSSREDFPDRVEYNTDIAGSSGARSPRTVSAPQESAPVKVLVILNLQKFDDGWKIVASHTSVAET